MPEKEPELITLAEAEEKTGVPVRTLRYAISVDKMWAQRNDTPRGPIYYTTLEEAERYKREFYRPHIKN